MFFAYLLFLAKAATLVIAILIVVFGIVAISTKGRHKSKERLEVKKLNDRYKEMESTLREKIFSKDIFKNFLKHQKKSDKFSDKSSNGSRKKIFVLNFIGDIRASAVKHLREEINAILTVATPADEVVLRLESPGGIVPGYGLAASQLHRIRNQQIPLTIAIDKFAASGGYMMACVGTKILSAPFAIVGSIGVIAQLPNFHRLLKKNDIDFEQIMAGQFKRTLTLFGENTEQGREKLQEEVNETQDLFKAFVSENRPKLDINQVATGEHWYGAKALELKLVDEIITSDDYLMTASKQADVYEICYTVKKGMMEKFSTSAQKSLDYCLTLLPIK